ncbi:MAG: phage virion morphogenesis protein [Verrucomicrobia bacterium]|nr:phage virion morphogenesis protein [Verrucomicrobiota bacterium]
MAVQLRDNLTPALRRLAAGVEDKKPILEAMGTQLASLTRRAFNEPNLRPAPWPNKLTFNASSGTFSRSEPSRLRKNQVLVRSIRIVKLTNSSVTVGTDRIYAAIHQLGGEIRAKNAPALAFKLGGQLFLRKKVTMPARPFFPFIGGKMTEAAQAKIRAIAEAKIKALAGGPGPAA